MNEIWSPIPGYENYEITKTGIVRSLNFYGRKGEIRELKLGNHIAGYHCITLSKDGKKRMFLVHQLMAITFLGFTPGGYKQVVDHINNIPTDNRLENLQIITQRENTTRFHKRDLPTGVKYNPRYKKRPYQTLIRIKGKVTRLGCYSTPEEASSVYQEKLKEINGK